MRYLFFFLLFYTGIQSFGQINCVISPADVDLCYLDSIVFQTTVSGQRPYSYQWLKNGVLIADESDSVLILHNVDYKDTASYQCIVSNGVSTDTSNSAHLRMHPKMTIDTLYRYNDLGCPGSCKGQYKTHISGGAPPYDYNWHGGHSQDTIVFGLCEGTYTFTVTDTNHCSLSKSYLVDVLRLPKVEFEKEPKDTVYLSNPLLTDSFSDTSAKNMTNWEWDFGDSTFVPNLNPATHYYTKTGKFLVKLNFTDLDGCDTTITQELTVKTAKIKVPNVFTPDHDPQDSNETFMITIEDSPEQNFGDAFLSNELVILDRWGRKVYTKNNYRSSKSGGDWNGENLSDGVYFYMLKCHGYYGDEVYKGSVTILRSH